jgi:hypothetical protein
MKVEITVSDNGCGMAGHYLRQIKFGYLTEELLARDQYCTDSD